jgi:hypothetical protein
MASGGGKTRNLVEAKRIAMASGGGKTRNLVESKRIEAMETGGGKTRSIMESKRIGMESEGGNIPHLITILLVAIIDAGRRFGSDPRALIRVTPRISSSSTA